MTIVDEIKARISIVDLVNENTAVKLRRSGKNWLGFCPYHANSHTPALVVFPDTGTWRCFGACADGGTVIDWVLKENPGWDVTEAVRELAKRANIPLHSEDMNGPDMKQRLAVRAREDALQIAARLFHKWLFEDQEALAYAHGRGWSDETLKAERVGFSGRLTAAQVDEMRQEFAMHQVATDSPNAVMILGLPKGSDVAGWARKHGIDPKSLPEEKVHGLMATPGLVYAHRPGGRITYMSRRQLPGHDGFEGDKGWVEWKSFNPYAVLAGERVPYFNHMHLREDDRIMVVEGQGDAVTLGQWGIPAMALSGSSWKSLTDTIRMLQEKYDAIFWATDSDAPGEKILTGKDGDWPLTAAFGPMLWVVRWPKHKWARPDGKEKTCKDANDLAQYFADQQVEKIVQADTVQKILDQAEPIVLEAARFAGQKQAAERQKALEIVLPLIARMPTNARNDYRLRLAKALFPEDLFPEYRGAPIRAFNKLLGDELKELKDDDNGVSAEIMPTLGGWYPENEDGSVGYLLETIYDRKTDKARFAFAKINLNADGKTGGREIGSANFVDINGYRYVPMIDDNIRYGTVLLPSEMGAVKPTRELLAMVELFIKRYFLLDNPIYYKLGALYALFTWVYDAFDSLMYLRARGGPGTGKSELMLRLGLVCYRMMITSGVSSLAGFKGLAHLYKGTLFIDEVDNLMKEDKGEMRALLNVRAMKKQARVVTMMEVLRSDGTHGFAPATTYVYGPTLLTMYGTFKDPGTESRCMNFDLAEKEAIELDRAGIEPGYISPEMETEAMQLRNMLLQWKLRTWRPTIELTPEDRKKYKLMDPLVSARINQIMRPLKVLAIREQDKDLLEDLFALGQANYQDEMTRRAGSFEAIIFRAVLAVDQREEYSKYVHTGKLGTLGVVRYVLYKDLALVANEIIDAENLSEGTEKDKKGEGVKSNTVGTICRDAFRLPVHRTPNGWAAVLDKGKLEIGKLRFGMQDDGGPGKMQDVSDKKDVVQGGLI